MSQTKNPETFSDYRVHYYAGSEELGADEMRVIAIGTGMPSVRPSQASACWLVEIPSLTNSHPERFLFDFGTNSMAKYGALQIPFEETRRAFISHLHSDHWGDIWAYWIGGLAQGRQSGIEIWGPSGETEEFGSLFAINRAMDAMAWDVATREDFFGSGSSSSGMGKLSEITQTTPEIQTQTRSYEIAGLNVTMNQFDHDRGVILYEDKENGITIKSWPANHGMPGAVSFSLEWNGMKVVYSGDTAPLTDELEPYKNEFRKANLLIHECFTPAYSHYDTEGATLEEPTKQHEYHTTPEQFGELMKEYEPDHAVAFHFYNDFDTSLDTYNRIRQSYDGPLTLSKDLMVWNLKPEGIIVRNIAYHPDAWLDGKF